MPKIKVNDLEANTEDLSEQALEHFGTAKLIATHIRYLQQKKAYYKFARKTLVIGLKDKLEQQKT